VAYGSDAFGGVIAVRTRRPDAAAPLRVRVAGLFGAGVPEQRAHVEVSKGFRTGGVLLQARHRDAGDYHAPGAQVPNSGWRDSGLLLRAERQVAGGFASAAWESDVGRDLGRPRSDAAALRVYSPFDTSHRFTGSYDRPRWAGFRRVQATILVGRHAQRTDQDRVPTPARPRSIERADVGTSDVQVRASGERALRRVRVSLGIDVSGRYGLEAHDSTITYTHAGAVASTRETASIVSAHRTDTGVYAQADATLTRWMAASAGIRGDVVAARNRGGFFGDRSVTNNALAGLAAVSLSPVPRLTLTTQLARGFRDPTLSDRFYRGPVGRGFIVGNPDLQPETSLQLDVALRYAAGRARLSAYYYRYRLTDLVELYAAPRDVFLFRNRGRATLEGTEIELVTQIGNGLAAEVSGQVARGGDAEGGPLDDVAPRTLVLTLRQSMGQRASAFARAAAVGRDGRPGPTEVVTPGFVRVDAGCAWRAGRGLELRASGSNLLDRAYYSSPGPRWVYAPGRHASLTAAVTF
jgi:outer membrane receptor protein involved in Fe transport